MAPFGGRVWWKKERVLMGASQHPAAAFLFMIAAFLLPTMTAQEKGGNLWTEQARLQHSLSQGLLNDPGTRVLAEFVPSSDQRPVLIPASSLSDSASSQLSTALRDCSPFLNLMFCCLAGTCSSRPPTGRRI
eukprot:3054358-Rhodomonas_salina.2